MMSFSKKRTGIKIGVINCRAGQKSPKEMFLNGISTIHILPKKCFLVIFSISNWLSLIDGMKIT